MSNTKHKCMYKIQEVAKCYVFLVFTYFLSAHPLRPKPIKPISEVKNNLH